MLLVVMLGLLIAPSEQAERRPPALTGVGLLAMCEKWEVENNRNARWTRDAVECVSYITGAVDAVAMYESILSPPASESVLRNPICLPGASVYEQYIRVVLNFLRTNPQYLHWNRALITVTALRDAFPCPKER